MTGQERTFAPAEPSAEEDPLAPEPQPETAYGRQPQRPRELRRHLLVIGWVFVATVIVIGVLILGELLRVTNASNNNACIQRASAHYLQALGPGVTAKFAGLDRFAGNSQLAKCGQ
jgi:hypothetical protein